jgi:TIR domain
VSQGTAMAADAAHGPDHQPKAKIFISYSRKDMAFADRLEAALNARGFEPLIDRTEIYAFEDWCWKTRSAGSPRGRAARRSRPRRHKLLSPRAAAEPRAAATF